MSNDKMDILISEIRGLRDDIKMVVEASASNSQSFNERVSAPVVKKHNSSMFQPSTGSLADSEFDDHAASLLA